MKNAAMAKSVSKIDPRIGIEFDLTDGRTFRMNAGNFTYREASQMDGGPMILTLLTKGDRKDADNEPFLVFSGVKGFRLIDVIYGLLGDDEPQPAAEFAEVGEG